MAVKSGLRVEPTAGAEEPVASEGRPMIVSPSAVAKSTADGLMATTFCTVFGTAMLRPTMSVTV